MFRLVNVDGRAALEHDGDWYDLGSSAVVRTLGPMQLNACWFSSSFSREDPSGRRVVGRDARHLRLPGDAWKLRT